MELKELLEKQKQYILKTFDFHIVYKVMHFLNWTWRYEEEPPNHYTITQSLSDLIDSAIEALLESSEDKMIASSGGFIVYIINDYIDVHFSVESIFVEECDINE